MAYPVNLDNVADTSDGVTDADELLFNGIIDALNRTQQYLGITGDTASSNLASTKTANIKYILNALDDAYAAALWVGGD